MLFPTYYYNILTYIETKLSTKSDNENAGCIFVRQLVYELFTNTKCNATTWLLELVNPFL